MLQLKKRKHPFILLELLLALSLIAICAIPLVQSPFFFLRKEKVYLRKIEYTRLEAIVTSKLKEKVYKKELPLKEIKKGRYQLPDQYFTLPDLSASPIVCTTHLELLTLKEKKEEKEEKGKVLIKATTSFFCNGKNESQNNDKENFIRIIAVSPS